MIKVSVAFVFFFVGVSIYLALSYQVYQPDFQDYTKNKELLWCSYWKGEEEKCLKQTQGLASWYDYSLPNYPNYSKSHYTAASRDYPRGTMLRVCRIGITRTDYYKPLLCVDVRVNDFGPEHCADNPVACPERILDLSSAAFKELTPLDKGIIEVKIEEIWKK